MLRDAGEAGADRRDPGGPWWQQPWQILSIESLAGRPILLTSDAAVLPVGFFDSYLFIIY